jgi:holo-[acyl-carrier protein] synthase
MIIGHGIDLVEHRSFARLIAKEEAFLKRCFTENEIATGQNTVDSVQWFASRFATKEAVMKALGTGWTQGISWHEIVVCPGPTGGMSVTLSGRTAAIAQQKNAKCWFLSISHTEQFSIASVIALDDLQAVTPDT